MRAVTMGPPPPSARLRVVLALIILCGLGGALGQMMGGCTQTPVSVPVRSLDRSGKVSFVCLEPPWFNGQVERPLSDCTSQQFTSQCQYLFENDAGVIDAGAGTLPHLYALVTQTARGEVAVVDTSTGVSSVLDENPLEPGANFIPVGGLPTGILSTPGGVATFVGVAGPQGQGGPGIWALPSSKIRPSSVGGTPDTCIAGTGDSGVEVVPSFVSWPVCSLPVAPGDMVLVNDPANGEGIQRPSCDSPYPLINGLNASDDPISFKERSSGRPKLVVTLPDLGGIAVIDAQELLAREPSSNAPCTVERWLPLQVNPADIESLAGVPAPPAGPACGNAAPATPPLLLGTPCRGDGDCGGLAGSCVSGSCKYTARPGGISYAADTGLLYVADVGAPLVHVVDLSEVCAPVERPPLLPTSAEVPQRVVFAGRVSVSPQPTPDAKRYLYATDVVDASVMVFDVSVTSTTRRPLQRQHPEWNPLQARDRIKLPAPPADILMVQHELPNIDPVSGTAPGGVLCDPDPNAVSCLPIDTHCDIGTSYRTSSDYTLGAGPQKLRGQFAFAVLTNGRVSVIDVADFDAPCRGPAIPSTLAGCSSNGTTALVTSKEISCNVVSQTLGEPRSNSYEGVGTFPGNHVPGIQTYPQLYNNDGSVFTATNTVTPPQMVATLPQGYPASVPAACLEACDALGCGNTCDTLPGCSLQLFVGGVQTPLDLRAGQCQTACEPAGAPCDVGSSECCGGTVCTPKSLHSTSGVCSPPACDANGAPCAPVSATCKPGNCAEVAPQPSSFIPGGLGGNNALAMNLEDPRAHVADQGWSVAYEGALPSFGQRSAPLVVPQGGVPTLTDANSRFCESGVLSENAMTELLAAQAALGQPTPVGLTAADLADYVQITSDLPDPASSYWTQPSTTATCNYSTCFDTFGPIDAPNLNATRDLRIVEAYDDHVEVEPRNGADFAKLFCCFPTQLSFTVRAGSQWVVIGDQTGFIHHVVADGTLDAKGNPKGTCRNSCDPVFSRRNGRLVESPRSTLYVADRAPGALDPSPALLNPMFRFAILSGQKSCNTAADCGSGSACDDQGKPLVQAATCPAGQTCVCTTKVLEAGKACTSDAQCTGFCDPTHLTGKEGTCYQLGQPERVSVRDNVFRFNTSGSFQAMSISLAVDPTALVEPQAITYLAPTFELAVTDGSVNGVIFISLQTPGLSRSFF